MQLAELQRILKHYSLYKDEVDGRDGRNTRQAVDALVKSRVGAKYLTWSDDRRKIAAEQIAYADAKIEVGAIDGLVGEQTRFARRVWAGRKTGDDSELNWRDQHFQAALVQLPHANSLQWPTQSKVIEFFGQINSNQVTLTMPFPLRLDWDPDTIVQRVSCHAKVHDALLSIWRRVLDHYGYEKLCQLRLDRFGGCLNPRKMRGSSAWSMHAWGIAWDVDPSRNQLHWGRDRAQLDETEYDAFWSIVEGQGATSLGRLKNFDWMHFQFARLS